MPIRLYRFLILKYLKVIGLCYIYVLIMFFSKQLYSVVRVFPTKPLGGSTMRRMPSSFANADTQPADSWFQLYVDVGLFAAVLY